MSNSRMKIAFPKIKLPDNYGGKNAIVLFSMARPADPNVGFATCIDESGKVHQNVPVSINEITEASKHPAFFIETDEIAPIQEGRILGPNGRPVR